MWEFIESLPLELFHKIASCDVGVHRALLSVPFFARSLKPGIITDFMIHFGYSVVITPLNIQWLRNRIVHRVDGPAIEWIDGHREEYYHNGKLHRKDRPAVVYSDRTVEYWEYGFQYR